MKKDNISNGVKDVMWHFLMKGKHVFTDEDIDELTEAVGRLIKMTTQKTAGQRKNSTDINWETLDMEFMRIVCYTTTLVLSGRLEELRSNYVTDLDTKDGGRHVGK